MGLAEGCAKRHPSKPGHQDNEAQKENIHEAPSAIDAPSGCNRFPVLIIFPRGVFKRTCFGFWA